MIMINLDAMLAKRKISSNELAAYVGITPANLSILKTGKAKAIRFSTLEAICRALECQPGDVLEYSEDEYKGQGQELTATGNTVEFDRAFGKMMNKLGMDWPPKEEEGWSDELKGG